MSGSLWGYLYTKVAPVALDPIKELGTGGEKAEMQSVLSINRLIHKKTLSTQSFLSLVFLQHLGML